MLFRDFVFRFPSSLWLEMNRKVPEFPPLVTGHGLEAFVVPFWRGGPTQRSHFLVRVLFSLMLIHDRRSLGFHLMTGHFLFVERNGVIPLHFFTPKIKISNLITRGKKHGVMFLI
jgi:membrane protein CcdC involved in cytochrome C biogenesis